MAKQEFDGQVYECALYTLPEEGKLTLQIPTCIFLMGVPEPKVITISKDYAEYKWADILFWTRKGFRVHMHNIKKAFTKSTTKRGTWFQFLREASKHFRERDKEIAKEISRTQKKLDKLLAKQQMYMKDK